MKTGELSISDSAWIIASVIVAAVVGYLYVNAASLGLKPTIALGLFVSFVIGCMLFVKDLKLFLIFAMVLSIWTGLAYHLTLRAMPPLQSRPFEEGIALTSVVFILPLLFFQWLFAASSMTTRRWPTIGNPLGTLLLAWILYTFISSRLTAVDFEFSLFEIAVLLQGFVLFFYLANNLETLRDIRVTVYALLAGALAQAVYMEMQYVTGLNYTLRGAFVTQRDAIFRPAGFFADEVLSSQMIAMIVPLVLTWYFTSSRRIMRVMAVVSMLVLLAGLLAGQHRASWGAVAVSFVIIVAIAEARKWVKPRTVFKSFVAATILVILASPMIIHRFERGTWGEDRIALAATALEIFKEHWLFGVGASNYSYYIEKNIPVEFRYTWQALVHSEYLLHLVQGGIIGALLYYLLMGIMCIKLWRLIRSPEPWISSVSAGIFAAVISSLLMRVLNTFHLPPSYLLTCVLLALTISMENLERKRLNEETKGPVPAEIP